MTFVSGATRYNDIVLVQLALTSLGHLFFGSRSAKISERLLALWTTHEISDVRAHCALSLRAVGEPRTVAFGMRSDVARCRWLTP